MGTTLRDIVFDICGGVCSTARLSRPCRPAARPAADPRQHLDTPVNYENLQKLGSIMGSGGMIVMDEDDSWSTVASST